MLSSQADFITDGVFGLGLFILFGAIAGMSFVYGIGAVLGFLGDISDE